MMPVTIMWTCERMEMVQIRVQIFFFYKTDGLAARSVPRVLFRIHNTRHNITKINTPTDQLPGNKALTG